MTSSASAFKRVTACVQASALRCVTAAEYFTAASKLIEAKMGLKPAAVAALGPEKSIQATPTRPQKEVDAQVLLLEARCTALDQTPVRAVAAASAAVQAALNFQQHCNLRGKSIVCYGVS